MGGTNEPIRWSPAAQAGAGRQARPPGRGGAGLERCPARAAARRAGSRGPDRPGTGPDRLRAAVRRWRRGSPRWFGVPAQDLRGTMSRSAFWAADVRVPAANITCRTLMLAGLKARQPPEATVPEG